MPNMLTAVELAAMLGNGKKFDGRNFEILHCRQRGGGSRISVRFHELVRTDFPSGGIYTSYPKVDAQITLLYTRDPLRDVFLAKILDELHRRATLQKPMTFSGIFQADGGCPECAWINIMHASPGYVTLHHLASAARQFFVQRDGTWMHPYFSLVLSSTHRRPSGSAAA